MQIVKLSSKNQIALPVELVRQFALTSSQKLTIEPTAEGILVRPIKTTIVDQVAGSLSTFVPSHKRRIPFTKVRAHTQRVVAKKLAQTS